MRWAFWWSLSLIIFVYLGYPFLLYCRSRFRPRPVMKSPFFPKVTVVMAVHNEENNIARKLRNLTELDYPAHLLSCVVVSDGSTDNTDAILSAWKHPQFQCRLLSKHQGKANALNAGMEIAQGEIVCFTDARQRIATDSLKKLTANFADPSVGCVSGELILGSADEKQMEGIQMYWSLEKKIRHWESNTNSVVGATGALYAARRSLVEPIPAGTILDDVLIPLAITRLGYRVAFEPGAFVWDELHPTPKQELRRKIRTLTGNYQLTRQQPWLLTRDNPIFFEFISHKILRLLVPFMLMVLLLSSMVLSGNFYRLAAIGQLTFYASSALAFVRFKVRPLGRLPEAAFAFLLLNAAAFMALVYVMTGRKKVWVR